MTVSKVSFSETPGQPVNSGKRRTRQKAEVRDALRGWTGFVSAKQLHAELSSRGSRIGLATVYRALNEMVITRQADVLKSPSGEALFRGCLSDAHHHHLVCRACGKTVEVHSEGVEEWARAAAADHGFSEVGHVLDIFGLCQTCSSSD